MTFLPNFGANLKSLLSEKSDVDILLEKIDIQRQRIDNLMQIVQTHENVLVSLSLKETLK